jgi:hypothetical protein
MERIVSLAAPRIRSAVDQLRRGSPALAWVTLGSLALLVASLVLQQLDPRLVTGAPVWLKPAKFAASIATTAPLLAWILGQLPRRRGLRLAAAVIAGAAVLELIIIVAQAVRGVPSHFNVSTPFDGALFTVMGLGITALWLAEAYILWRTFRHRFATPARTWAIRLGLIGALLGGGLGFLMPRPTPAQLTALKAGQQVPTVGAHTVGPPDGGPGLPVTRWSTRGGDLRVPHFLGLHALQVLPFFALFFERRRRPDARPVVALSVGWIGLVLVALQQALRGQPLLAPDAGTLGAAAIVLVVAVAVARGLPVQARSLAGSIEPRASLG